MLFYRWKTLNQEPIADESFFSRDLALFTAAIVISTSAIIVWFGTSAPILGSSVETTFFYNETHVALAIIIGLLNGLSLLLKWKQTKGQEFIKKSIFPVAASITLTVLIVLFGGISDIMMILLILTTSFSLSVNLEIAIRIIRGNLKMLGAYVAHIGIALFILGVIGSAAYSDQTDIDLVKNQPKEAFGYQMTFTGYHPIENDTKYSFNIEVKKGDKSYKVSPVMYVSDFNNGLMREPAILTMLTKDIYVSPIGYEEGNTNTDGSSVSLEKGKTIEFNGVKITFDEFDIAPETMMAMQQGEDFEMGARLTAEFKGIKKQFELKRKSISGKVEFTSEHLKDFNVVVRLVNLSASNIDLSFSSSDGEKSKQGEEKKEVLSVTASVKPFINFVWSGVAVMVLGFFISVARRLKESLGQPTL
jgi:cytochrome c-type biogenesis protein CcmF